ncbi:flagellar protein FliS [Paenibacillus tianmuensis]|uniref:Flagellar secretion chaperone FliS n=1 Tax=Paenibacillus tianmuensis TaxID=624147 RepID=A0A1G4RP45_9BACL|nr:flagellar export chaperone FliS [Paenibacillus tianmuensis]SCW58598.1 flagellar protein FliS [Paenibacillus tianmuensis]
MNPANNIYLKTQINTSHPGELTLMLYNGCIKFMKQALDSIQQKDFEGKNEYIKKSLDIIDELIITLDMNYDISRNLYSLYEFMKNNLIKGNMSLDTRCILDVIELMTELRDTWVQALKQAKTNGTKVTV